MNKKGFLGADLVFDLDTSYEKEKHEHNPILCPYCLDMFVDGLKTKGAEESIKAMDLAELVAQLL
jgi:DNA primase catalytic subunit